MIILRRRCWPIEFKPGSTEGGCGGFTSPGLRFGICYLCLSLARQTLYELAGARRQAVDLTAVSEDKGATDDQLTVVKHDGSRQVVTDHRRSAMLKDISIDSITDVHA